MSVRPCGVCSLWDMVLCKRTVEGTSEDFEVKTGVRQSCVLSPLLFNCFMDRIVNEAMEVTGGGLHVECTTGRGLFLSYRGKTPLTTCILNALYADNLTLVAENRKELQQMIDALDRACTRWGMRISGDKTKVLSVGEPPRDHPAITLKGQALEEVDSFSYLGSEVEQMSRVKKDAKIRIEKAATVCQLWRRKVFRSQNLNRRTTGQWSLWCSSMGKRPGW